MSSIDKDGRVIGHPKPPKRKRKVTRPSGPAEDTIQRGVERGFHGSAQKQGSINV